MMGSCQQGSSSICIASIGSTSSMLGRSRCLACLTVTMRTCPCCSGGRWSAPPSRLGLGASRSALFCLAGQDPRVLARRPLRVSILLQGRPPDGFPRLGPDALIAIRG
ncbi:hypothetical protein ACE6H2_016441 [Prunus campanulata]